MKKNFLHLFLLASVLLFAVSCSKDIVEADSTVDKPQDSGTGWNFGTSKTVTISVTASDLQDSPIAKTGVELYAKNPKIAGSSNWDSSVVPFAQSQTDANGSFSTTVTVESTVDTVYLYLSHISFSEPRAIPLTSSSISLDLHPAGYASTKSALKAAVASTPWKYQVSPYNSASNLWVLGDYDAKGYPEYLVGRDTYTSAFLSAISSSFPEKKDMTATHPDLFVDGTTSNLATTASCNVWISFLSEGAWNNNAVGYFYYPTGSAPSTAASIAKRIVIFPNVQDASGNSGDLLCSMVQGDKVELKYYDEVSGTWTEVFPAGITIGWFLISKGYSTSSLTSGNIGIQAGSPFYSLPGLNSDARQHNIIYFDQTSQTAVIGFEDLSMSSGSDKDFNDVVFAITANPITAINTSGLPVLVQTSQTDTDGDGVIDSNDQYPDDPQRAYDVFYPTSGTGTLAFEDNWPKQGDYDFNDLVLGYQYHLVTNAYNAVKDVKVAYDVKAVGANYRNGFAVQFGTGPGNVESVAGQQLSGNTLFSLSSSTSGYETGQSYAVIPVFNDAHALFGYTASTPYINTLEGTSANAVTATPVAIDLNVTFGIPVNPSSLGTPPYNAFIVVNKDRGREVHLAGKVPTSKADSKYFGTQDDQTNASTSVYYRNSSSFPWALDIPTNFEYPKEYNRVDQAYLFYGTWATSQGGSYADWYSNTAGNYRNTGKIYK